MNKCNLIELAESSVENIFLFSHFVDRAEIFSGPSNPFLIGLKTESYDDIWFEMEIVNANALSEWEDDGKPEKWDEKWVANYKIDVIELVNKFLALLKEK